MNAISLARLQELHPALREKILELEQMLQAEGIRIEVVQGLRTWAQQNGLYQQGRTVPGRIVTNAPAGYSWHNYGLACDCAPMNPDTSIDWNGNHPQWKRMEQVGESLGLTSGATFVRLVDAPHFQLTGRFPVNAPDGKCRQLFAEGGVGAVWAEAGIT